MKILLTGATGFIGKHLVKKLSNNHELFALVRENSDISEVRDYCQCITNLENINVDTVIHLASCFLAAHKFEDIENLVSSNVTLGTKLLDQTSKLGVKFFINVGTYWQHYEGADYAPVNLYAATKQAFEDILRFYADTTYLKVVNIKLNDTFGPGDTRRKVFNLWREIAESGEHLSMSPGEQIMDIVYIDDVVSAFEAMIDYLPNQKNKIETYKVESKERLSLKEMAKVFEKAIDKKLDIAWGERPYRPREVMNPKCPHDIVPGWEAKYGFMDAIERML